MSDNKLMDKLVAGFNDMRQEMESRISKLDSEISERNREYQDAKEELAALTASADELYQMDNDWYHKYIEARNHGGNTDYTYRQLEKVKILLFMVNGFNESLTLEKPGKQGGLIVIHREDIYSNPLSKDRLQEAERTFPDYYQKGKSIKSIMEAQSRINHSRSSFEEKRDSLKKKLENLLTQPIEKKAEIYYEWLVEKLNAAKSAEEYSALAKKFSDISGYKDCAALAEKCKELAEIEKLDKELNAKLKSLDDDIAELKAELQTEKDSSWWVLFAGGVLGIILALIIKGGVGYAMIPGGVVGLIIGFISCIIIDSNIEKKYEPKLQELENQKPALHSEYDRKKEEVRKNYQS